MEEADRGPVGISASLAPALRKAHSGVSALPCGLPMTKARAVEARAFAFSLPGLFRESVSQDDALNPHAFRAPEPHEVETRVVATALEGLGFCKKGEGGPFVEDDKLRVGGALPTNTDGGGLSACHPGMRGIFLLVEAARQLRAEFAGTPRQVPDAELACVSATGGWFSAASTAILGRN